MSCSFIGIFDVFHIAVITDFRYYALYVCPIQFPKYNNELLYPPPLYTTKVYWTQIKYSLESDTSLHTLFVVLPWNWFYLFKDNQKKQIYILVFTFFFLSPSFISFNMCFFIHMFLVYLFGIQNVFSSYIQAFGELCQMKSIYKAVKKLGIEVKKCGQHGTRFLEQISLTKASLLEE